MQSKHNKIAIGGLSGTGKGTIAKILAEKLGFEKISAGNFLRAIAAERGMTILELDRYMYDNPEEGKKLDVMADKYIEDYGKEHENYVAEGRLAAHFTKDGFKILLTCDDRRFDRIANRDSISFEQAAVETRHREETYEQRYGRAYNLADWHDPKYYDLVIDTSELTPEQIVDKIIKEIS